MYLVTHWDMLNRFFGGPRRVRLCVGTFNWGVRGFCRDVFFTRPLEQMRGDHFLAFGQLKDGLQIWGRKGVNVVFLRRHQQHYLRAREHGEFVCLMDEPRYRMGKGDITTFLSRPDFRLEKVVLPVR